MANTDAKLNTETLEVICQKCEKPIQNISESMKRVLKSQGQVIRHEVKKAFTIACMNCKANREVVLNVDNQTICSICHNTISLHSAMRLAMEESGVKLRKLDSGTEVKVKAKRNKKAK